MAFHRIGLALGSGAARKWSYIGVIDALKEAGVEPESSVEPRWERWWAPRMSLGTELIWQWAEAASWRWIVPPLDVRLTGGALSTPSRRSSSCAESGSGTDRELFQGLRRRRYGFCHWT